MTAIRIGTAGWTIPRDQADHFPAEGTSLERYAAHLNCAEINSSFHRPHRASTWQRWGESVPDGFRFAVKLPKTITHERKLADCSDLVGEFVSEAGGLVDKWAVLLVQLPPKLAFDVQLVGDFFAELAQRCPAALACEPRHASWFEPAADALLSAHCVARVAADPALSDFAARPGGWRGLSYWRLHGSPAMYRSPYGDRVAGYGEALKAEAAAGREAWCIFDNTASSAAMGDALNLTARVA